MSKKPDLPAAPNHLSTEAKAEWERVTAELHKRGTLSLVDRAALAAYCQAYGLWQQTETALAEMARRDEATKGLLIKTASGSVVANPLLLTAKEAMDTAVRLSRELGLKPGGQVDSNGRPTLYTEPLADEICARISCGEPLVAICREEGMPSYRTVMGWRLSQPGFLQKYTDARAEQGNADADAVNDLAARVVRGEVDASAGRVAIDALKWSAGHRQPNIYGNKLAIGGAKGQPPVQTVDLTHASEDDLKRLEAILGPLAVAAGNDPGTGEGGTPAA